VRCPLLPSLQASIDPTTSAGELSELRLAGVGAMQENILDEENINVSAREDKGKGEKAKKRGKRGGNTHDEQPPVKREKRAK
jgi:hypothetical protein